MTAAAASRDEIARLFGRAAFGATAADLDTWTGRPYADAVNSLVDFAPRGQRSAPADETARVTLTRTGVNNVDAAAARLWWLERMRTTRFPLEERMTLFWHSHFATAVRHPFPDVAMMMVQNETMRRHALGDFRSLVRAITLDPAMMEWLDGSKNSIPAPNENFAREFMELFTLGRAPQIFDEHDVRDAARVFTGWTVNPSFRTVAFNAAGHDSGTKTVLGATVANADEHEYAHLIDIALAQPVAARFLAAKLVQNFAYEPDFTNLLTKPDSLVAAVADTLQRSNWDVRAAMRTLLSSDEFRTGDAGARRLLVRQPAQVAVAAAKAFGVSFDDLLSYTVGRMGQELFSPPSVGGFPTGTAWLSPSTVLGRYYFAQALANREPANLPASGDVDGWAQRLGLAGLSDTTVDALRSYQSSAARETEAVRQQSVLVLLLVSPDWTVV